MICDKKLIHKDGYYSSSRKTKPLISESPGNMSRMITDWNNNKQDYPKNINLIQLIEQQVANCNETLACYFNEQTLSFASLNTQANQLAHYILQNTAEPGQHILIHLDRGIASIIAILATLKSGNIYVPIEHISSLEFSQDVIKDCDIKMIISDNNFMEELCRSDIKNTPKLLNLEVEKHLIEKMPSTNPQHAKYHTEAYILYTSGSTGKPKGVQIKQKSLLNLLFAMQKIIHFTNNDKILALTPITFDISAVEFYLPLLFGGSFILGDTETRYNPYKITQIIEKHAITIMQATPVTWQMLIDSDWKNHQKIKMLSGGESLNTDLAYNLLKTNAPLWNFYGPTETTIWSTFHKVTNIDKNKPFIPIGKPIANTQVFVLNKNLQQQPINSIGELYIGGDGVAAGYLHLPEITQKKFIKIPEFKGRLYKTGDLAYISAKHELHFIGRVDTQIKINGHRVEVSAIENILLEHDAIKECVVIAPSQILIAYVVLKDINVTPEALNTYLKSHLPAYMLPSQYRQITELPLTTNGKINRKQLAKIQGDELRTNEQERQTCTNKFERIILELTKKHCKKQNITSKSNFNELGISSIGLVNLTKTINEIINYPINVTDLINYPTIRALSKLLLANENVELNINHQQVKQNLHTPYNKNLQDTDIAIIGMACKFPQTDNYDEFWQLILDKKNAITFFNQDELVKAGISPELVNNKNYVPARGTISDIDKFDANFFGITPAEAKLMDPQHRVFLEQSWSALEDSGYIPENFPGRISVFAGMNDSTYLQNQILKNNHIQAEFTQQQIMLATSPHYLATKVSYHLGLSGPSMTINTACSTGLVAINSAVENLREGKSEMAIAGAINISVPQKSGYLYQDMGIFSPDGHCNVFADNASGTVISNGCGVVILKKLSNALQDNDKIIAVIKGSAINNDGDTKSGFTSPSIKGQVRCIQDALQNAKIDPTNIEFVEAHGTGTIVGDPIEVAALASGYKFQDHNKSSFCALGSIKANIGHADTASGMAGFIKTSLAIYHKILPANINFASANQQIDFSKTPFYVNIENTTWQTKHKLRSAAVNSLGFGGTNAHLILQEPPEPIATSISKPANIFLISAKVTSSFNQAVKNIKQYLNTIQEHDPNEIKLADSAYTSQLGRKHFQERLAIVYSDYNQLISILNSPKEIAKRSSSIPSTDERKVVFGFVGQGAQYISMAYDIYIQQPTFRKIVDKCFALIYKESKVDLQKILFPNATTSQQANVEMARTQNAQPCLFVIEYAMAKLLISLGITPSGMIGHSLGEYVAAAVADVLSLEDAIKLILARSKLMASTKPGVMLAIPMAKQEIEPYLCDSVGIAAHNAPKMCVVSGSIESTTKFINIIKPILAKKNLNYQRLHTSHAFHSQHMDPILDEFLEKIKDIKINPPKIPFISNITGNWISQADLNSKKYWANHMRNAVLFSDGIQNLNLSKDDLFIEIGPGNTLSQLILQQQTIKPQILNTVPHYVNSDENSYQFLLQTIANLWLLNKKINWQELYTNEIRRRVKLPTYPFAKQSHWIHATGSSNQEAQHSGLYTPTWERTASLNYNVASKSNPDDTWLIFGNNPQVNLHLLTQVKNGYEITLGDKFSINEQRNFTLNPRVKKHFFDLLKQIDPSSKTIKVVHCNLLSSSQDINKTLFHGAFCLLYLCQAFNETYPNKVLEILIFSKNIYNVTGYEKIDPIKASILGPCKVIPQEQDNIKIGLIDVEEQHIPNLQINNKLTSISKASFKDEIAWRGNYSWKQKLKIYKPSSEPYYQRIHEHGTYLITGGLGGLGLAIAEELATKYSANIILISRSAILAQDKWQEFLDDPQNANHSQYNKISSLANIKTFANKLHIFNANINDPAEIQRILDLIKSQHQHINGVIHAAGVAGKGIAELKKIETYNQVLAPKLYGSKYLIEALANEKLDFFAAFSSTTAITGFPGQIDYCSANRVLDAFISQAASTFKHKVFCTTMNWQAWREVGMAADSESMLINLDETNSIDPKEGCKIFQEIINSNESQVIISNNDLNLYDHEKLKIAPHIQIAKIPKTTNQGQSSYTIDNLLDIWRSTLEVSKITIYDDFYELGGNSLLAINLIAKIRTRFAINIPSTVLFKERTIEDLANLIDSHINANLDISPLVQIKKGDKKQPPIFFIHPIGGTVFCYLELAKNLQTDSTIYAIQDPSIECNHNIFNSITEQATYYRKIIEITQPSGPYYLCGASYGASICMEIAYQLESNKKFVKFVGLIDGWGYTPKQKYDPNYVKDIINIHRKPANSIAKLDVLESIIMKRLKMMEEHQHKKITAPVSLFKATKILDEYKKINIKDNYWSKYCALPLKIFNIAGDHNSMLEQPNVQNLVAKLLHCLRSLLTEVEMY